MMDWADMTSDEWDPMLTDYQDPDFNAYMQGVGRDLTNHNGTGANLFVDNFPTDLGEEGLLNLFSEFGTVLRASLKQSNRLDKRLTFGFVTMDSGHSAQAAISVWNRRPFPSKNGIPLKVTPAITKEEKTRRQNFKQLDSEFMSRFRERRLHMDDDIRPSARHHLDDDVRSSVSMYTDRSRGNEIPYEMRQPSRALMGAFPSAPSVMGRGYRKQFPQYPEEMPSHRTVPTFRGMQGFGRKSFDSMLMGQGRGRGHMNEMRQRLAGPSHTMTSYGRGFRRPEQQIPAAPKRRITVNLKCCLNCGKEDSGYRCQCCKMYYCSSQCQRDDWPRHQEICLDVSLHNYKARMEMDLTSEITGPNLVHHDIEMNMNGSHQTREEPIDVVRGRRAENHVRNDRGYESDAPSRTTRNRDMNGGKNTTDRRHENEKERRGYNKVFENSNKNKEPFNGPITSPKKFDKDVDNKRREHDYADKKDAVDNKRREHNNNNVNKKDTIEKKFFSNRPQPNQSASPPENGDRFSKNKQEDRASGYSNRPQPNQSASQPESGDRFSKNKQQEDRASGYSKRRGPGPDGDNSRSSPDSKPSPTDAAKGKQPVKNQKKAIGIGEKGDALCDLVSQTIEKGRIGECNISHYESPSKFWIILIEDVCDFLNISLLYKEQLNEEEQGMVQHVKAGELYCIIEDDYWTRVKVVTVNKDNTVVAFYPDVGKQETLKLSQLYHLDESMRVCPAQAILCCIGGAKPSGQAFWNMKAKKMVKEWFGEPYTKTLTYRVMDMRGNAHAVDIYDSKKEHLRYLLLNAGVADKCGKSENLPKLTSNITDVKSNQEAADSAKR